MRGGGSGKKVNITDMGDIKGCVWCHGALDTMDGVYMGGGVMGIYMNLNLNN